MSVLPLQTILNQLWPSITTQAAGAAADPNLLININDLLQRLYNSDDIDFVGKFEDQLNLPVYTDPTTLQQTIALPPWYITAEYIHDNLGDIPMRSAFARYEDDRNMWADERHADDLGDTFCTYFNLPTSGKLFVQTSAAVSGSPTIIIQGLDQNGIPVSVGGINGESVVLSAAGATTVTTFSSVTGITKSTYINSVTNLYLVGTPNTLIGQYMGNDLNPRIRRYYICTAPRATLLAIKVRRRFIPVNYPTDLVCPGMTGALKNGLLSLNFENQADENRNSYHWGSMLKILDGELKQYLGSSQLGTFQMDAGTSLGAIGNII